MIKLTNILNEIKINSPGLSKKDIEALNNIIDEQFGSGVSEGGPEDLICETYEIDEDDEDDEYSYYKDIKYIINTYNRRTLVTNDVALAQPDDFPCPGAPPNSYYVRIEVDDDSITVCTPSISNNADYSMGWFDIKGKHYPDLKNFNEDGEYIGE
jgi:hypothetical protein